MKCSLFGASDARLSELESRYHRGTLGQEDWTMKCKCGATWLGIAAAVLLGVGVLALALAAGRGEDTAVADEPTVATADTQPATCMSPAAMGSCKGCGAKGDACACGPRAKFANDRCPMMGSKIDPASVPASLTREHRGQKVAFCCGGCPVAWDKLSETGKQAKLDAARTDE